MQELLACVCVSLCTTVVHNTAQNSSDYLPSYPPDKHQSSDAVFWEREKRDYDFTRPVDYDIVSSRENPVMCIVYH